MKKSLDVLIWAVLLFLITPSGMALASWNAVPGDATYSWKLSLEKILIAILSPSDKLQSATQVKITERRFNEFEQIVESEYAIEGLKNLNEQIAVTTNNVQKIDQSQSRTEVTEAYVDSLKKMSASLDEQKSKAKTGQITFASTQKTTTTGSSNLKDVQISPSSTPKTVKNNQSPQPTVATQPVNQPVTQPIAQPTASQPSNNQTNQESSAPVNSDEVIEQIEETQNNIEQVIKELEKKQKEDEDEKNKGKNNALNDLTQEERKALIEKIQDKVEKKEEKNNKKD